MAKVRQPKSKFRLIGSVRSFINRFNVERPSTADAVYFPAWLVDSEAKIKLTESATVMLSLQI